MRLSSPFPSVCRYHYYRIYGKSGSVSGSALFWEAASGSALEWKAGVGSALKSTCRCSKLSRGGPWSPTLEALRLQWSPRESFDQWTVVADSNHFDKEKDPDPYYTVVKRWIWIRVRIQVKSRIRIRIKVTRIRKPDKIVSTCILGAWIWVLSVLLKLKTNMRNIYLGNNCVFFRIRIRGAVILTYESRSGFKKQKKLSIRPDPNPT